MCTTVMQSEHLHIMVDGERMKTQGKAGIHVGRYRGCQSSGEKRNQEQKSTLRSWGVRGHAVSGKGKGRGKINSMGDMK